MSARLLSVNRSPLAGRLRHSSSAGRAPGTGGSALSNGTNTHFRGRHSFFNVTGKAMTCLQPRMDGFYLDGTNEMINPNAVTLRMALEYPAGVFKQLTFRNLIDGLLLPGEDLDADLTEAHLPDEAQYWLRVWGYVTSGQFWAKSSIVLNNSTLGEFGEQGIGLADTTMGGTITGTTPVPRPSIVRTPWRKGMKKVVFGIGGDSQAAGAGDGSVDARGNTGGFARGTTGRTPCLLMAVSGTELRYQLLAGKMAYRLKLMRDAGLTDFLARWGNNDGSASGRTAAEINADVLTMGTLVNGNGHRFWYHTMPPRSTTIDDWQTVAGQTPSTSGNGFFQGGASSPRSFVNDTTRGKPYPIFDYFETALASEATPGESIWGCGASFNPRLRPVDNLAVTGVTSASVFASNATGRPTDYYKFGGAVVFTGNVTSALAGVRRLVSGFTSGGQFTLSSALPVAPAAGDTFTAYHPVTAQTDDGVHFNIGSGGYGGHYIAADVIGKKLDELLR